MSTPGRHRHTLRVASSDVDNLGHVNNARYLEYLESGRMAWYATVGFMPLYHAALGGTPLGTVVVNVNIDFERECLADELLQVYTVPARAGGKSYALAQSITKAGGEVAARATVTSVVMDLEARVAVPLPGRVRALFPAS